MPNDSRGLQFRINLYFCCRNHEKDAEFCHRLNLLKAQTVARAGDLKAALAVLHPLTKPLASNPADLTRLYTSWQVASDHKDRGNQFFKEGNLQGIGSILA